MKPRRILKISLTDEARLQTLASITLSPLRIGVLTALLVISMLSAGYLLVLMTPLKTLIPGYFRESQRAQTQEALLRVDSLRAAWMRNEAYIENINSILDSSRAPVSLPAEPSAPRPAIDSLLPPSPTETSFVRMMREREKFNISVVAPLAAEGMLFYPITEEGIFAADSRESRKARIILPDGATVMAVADGVVVASFFDNNVSAYTLLLQHDNGFVSRYSSIGTPLVGEGETVTGGQALSMAPSPRGGRPSEVWIQLWHDTTPLRPYDYVSSPRVHSPLQQ